MLMMEVYLMKQQSISIIGNKRSTHYSLLVWMNWRSICWIRDIPPSHQERIAWTQNDYVNLYYSTWWNGDYAPLLQCNWVLIMLKDRWYRQTQMNVEDNVDHRIQSIVMIQIMYTSASTKSITTICNNPFFSIPNGTWTSFNIRCIQFSSIRLPTLTQPSEMFDYFKKIVEYSFMSSKTSISEGTEEDTFDLG